MERYDATLPPDTETLLPRKELAQRHEVSIGTCKRRERAGLLHPLKVGQTVHYRLSDIVAMEAAARDTSAGQAHECLAAKGSDALPPRIVQPGRPHHNLTASHRLPDGDRV